MTAGYNYCGTGYFDDCPQCGQRYYSEHKCDAAPPRGTPVDDEGAIEAHFKFRKDYKGEENDRQNAVSK